MVVDNGKQDREVRTSSTKVRFEINLYVAANASHKRVYMVKVEANISGSWVPVETLVNRSSGTLDDYRDIGDGQALWLEDDETTHIFHLDASASSTPSKYRITISKPYLAFTTLPRHDSGNNQVSVTVRNSSGDNQEITVRAWCDDDPNDGYGYPDKNYMASSKPTFNKNSDTAFMLCAGYVFTHQDNVNIRAELPGSKSTSLQVVNGTVRWPLTQKTLWHPQRDTRGDAVAIGGLQIAGKDNEDSRIGRCTSSFTLKRRDLRSTNTIPTVSTTAHCAEDSRTDPFTWRQGSIPLAPAHPNVDEIASEVRIPVYTWTTTITSAQNPAGNMYGYEKGRFGSIGKETFEHRRTTYGIEYIKWSGNKVKIGLAGCLKSSEFVSLRLGSRVFRASAAAYGWNAPDSHCEGNRGQNQWFEVNSSSNPLPAGSSVAVKLNLVAPTCEVPGESADKCRRGDQAYATLLDSVRSMDGYIFKPRVENKEQDPKALRMEYFEDSGARFKVVRARPPILKDIVHKVGRTTGWTSGKVEMYKEGEADPFCPGGKSGEGDNRLEGVPYVIECLVHAHFLAAGGDSGSPVFVQAKDDPNTPDREVVLVGVVIAESYSDHRGIFVPIERIYAESLLDGYDWATESLRPVPSLDDSKKEMLTVAGDGPTIEAKFHTNDFSKGLGLRYTAALYRTSEGVTSQVKDIYGSIYAREVSHEDKADTPGPIAQFDGANIHVNHRNGDFFVRTRMCVSDITDPQSSEVCGDYGSSGGKSVTPVPALSNPSVARLTNGDTQVSWNMISGVNNYQVNYREWESGDSWTSVFTTDTTKEIPCIDDDVSYEIKIRAHADTSGVYDGKWGFWSGSVATRSVKCSIWSAGAAGATGYALPPATPPEGLLANLHGITDVDLRWDSLDGANRYRVEFRSDGAGEWTTAGDNIVDTSWTIPDLSCGRTYDFRVRAHGDGTTYAEDWSPPSASVSVTTQTCNRPPVFESDDYTFSISENATTTSVVGAVSAVDPDGDSLSYSIISGNETDMFAIEDTSGEISVIDHLDHETVPLYNLVAEAADQHGAAATTSVEILVTDVAESPPFSSSTTTQTLISAPQNLAATSTHDSVTLTWDPSDDPTITGYRILRRVADQDTFREFETSDGADTAYIDTADIEPNTRYIYSIHALSDSVISPVSQVVATTPAPP